MGRPCQRAAGLLSSGIELFHWPRLASSPLPHDKLNSTDSWSYNQWMRKCGGRPASGLHHEADDREDEDDGGDDYVAR